MHQRPSPPLKGSLVQKSCHLFPGPQREGAVSGVDAVAVGEEERDRGGAVVGIGHGDPTWLAAHPGELAPFAICWFDNLTASDTMRSLTASGGDSVERLL